MGIFCFSRIFELAFAVSLKLSEGFTKTKWIIAFIVCSACSFYFLSKSLGKIPIGTVIIGILSFNEPSTFLRLFFITLIIIAMIGLKLS